MKDRCAFLDSSAFVKLVVPEPESAALRRYLRRRGNLVSAALLRTEAVRAVRAHGPRSVRAARRIMGRMLLIRLSQHLLDAAADLDPPELRSLDAVHLAAALSLGGDLGVIITYDEHMATGARELGLPVQSPS